MRHGALQQCSRKDTMQERGNYTVRLIVGKLQKAKRKKEKKKLVSEKTDRYGVCQCQLRTNLWYSGKHSQPSHLHLRMRQVTGTLTRAKGTGLSWLAAPGHDGRSRQALACLHLKCSCLGTQRRTGFIKPVQGHQKGSTADSSGLK